jgi:hypothetical protein
MAGLKNESTIEVDFWDEYDLEKGSLINLDINKIVTDLTIIPDGVKPAFFGDESLKVLRFEKLYQD